MANDPASRLVTVFGGSGFVGRHTVRALAKRGYRVRAAMRRPDLAGHLQPLGGVGQIAAVQANLRYPWSVERAVQGADHVINLVGILAESGSQKFGSVQAQGARTVAQAAKDAGAALAHVSAIGASEKSDAGYARTKAAGEAYVRQILPDAVIMRPSIMFGPEDDFFNRFAAMARIAPALPLVGGGQTRLQPVYVGDVAEAIAQSVDGRCKPGATYELGGPEVVTFRECLELMLNVIDRKKPLVTLPFSVASAIGSVMQYLPNPPITPDQVTMLKSDNVVSESAIAAGCTLQGLGINPASMAAVLPSYLVRFRKHGQFEANRGL